MGFKMICVDGYKAFHGKMKISPKRLGYEPFILEGDWLYKPEFDCWYVSQPDQWTRSFSNSICEVVAE